MRYRSALLALGICALAVSIGAWSAHAADTSRKPQPDTATPGMATTQRKSQAAPEKTAQAARIVSTGERVELASNLVAEQPTVFVFYKPAIEAERAFVSDLQIDLRRRSLEESLLLVALKNGTEAVAKQYDVTVTPTTVIYDRRGRKVAQSGDALETRAAIVKAMGVKRIDWAEEGDPRLKLMQDALGQTAIPDIIRTLSLQPDHARLFVELAAKLQFADGFLDRRTKELIGTYVSSLNGCNYCLGSHANSLRLQGMALEDVDAIAALNLEKADLTPKERGLLNYVKLLTLEPSHVRDHNVERLRKAGWTDEQISEASAVTSIFAFANRMASAYGLDYPARGWLPPERRATLTASKNTPVEPGASSTAAVTTGERP